MVSNESMRHWKWRLWLPGVLGCATAGLMAWEQANARVIASMGMAWDTGAPMWPYQTPEILLAILNAPAYIIAAPVWWTFNLNSAEQRHPVLLIASVALWFFVGRAIDDRRRATKRMPVRLWLRLLFVIVAGAAVYVGARQVFDGAAWWSKYGEFHVASILILVRIVSFAPWCLAVGTIGAWTLSRWSKC